jgi:hypothetical protein
VTSRPNTAAIRVLQYLWIGVCAGCTQSAPAPTCAFAVTPDGGLPDADEFDGAPGQPGFLPSDECMVLCNGVPLCTVIAGSSPAQVGCYAACL